ncbi:MAG: hypothetical protein M3457_06915 [Chloroflexota bacterium]|nr:hypothetical protein [Chloroflexota bacterium]
MKNILSHVRPDHRVMVPEALSAAGMDIDEIGARYERAERLRHLAAKAVAKRVSEAQRTFQEAMERPTEGAAPELQRVRVGLLELDRRYQTKDRYNEQRARAIARDMDLSKIGVLQVNIRPGDPTRTLWCFDGQHRKQAIIWRLGPDYMVDALVHHLPYEAEAGLFAKQHDDQKRVPDAIRFNAELESGNPEAIAAKELADRLGVSLGKKAQSKTVATQAFLECVRRKGAEATEEGLGYVLGRWHGSRASLEAHISKGVVWFVANRRDHEHYSAKKVRDTLAHIDLVDLENIGGTYEAHKMTKPQGIAAAIVERYNENRRQLLPPWKMPRGEK